MSHIDPIEHRKPLPLMELADLWTLVQPTCRELIPEFGRVETHSGHIGITLYTDSAHLRAFFRGNWGGVKEPQASIAEIVIVALRRESMAASPQIVPGSRYINAARSLIVSVGSEYYGNVKVSVRGLCSAAVRTLGRGGFLHGASMKLSKFGIVIGGASGAGKTTTTRALFELFPSAAWIINDDWGWADPDSAKLHFTGEPNLHMKYRSVGAIAPNLEIDSTQRLSENFEGDAENPHARLLIPRDEVFMGAVAQQAPFNAFIVLIRDFSRPFFVRQLTSDDVNLLEEAEYSAFYQRNERFLDGSLLLIDNEDMSAERKRFRNLLVRIPALLINNVSTPSAAALAVSQHLERLDNIDDCSFANSVA